MPGGSRPFLLISLFLFLLFAGYLWLSPYFTMVNIRDAVSDKDTEKLRAHVEFSTLRQNLKAQPFKVPLFVDLFISAASG
jgi:hypothetical protein